MRLEIKDLAFSYTKGATLFQDVTFSLKNGQIMSILGANGAGKSTLLNCVANLLHPTHGSILLDQTPLEQMDLREIARTIGYVPQSHTPAYAYAVRDFVVMGRAPHLGPFQQPGAEDFALVDRTLAELGIAHLAERPYTELSGGERQQVTIARVIVQQPAIIMLDEPTNHLDYGNQLRMLRMVRDLADRGFGILMTTHNPDHVILLGGTVGILDHSGHLAVGEGGAVMTEERLRTLYNSDLRLVYVDEVSRQVCIAKKI